MKQIEVRDQTRLSLAKCVELVLSGIKYRLFRAGVTVAIIALAVAFLMTMLTESLFARRVAASIDALTAPRRAFNFWLSRVSAPLAEDELTAELAGAVAGSPRWQEFRAWGDLSEEQLAKLSDVARLQQTYLAYFDDELEEGERRPMLGSARGADILELLQDERAYRQFAEEYRRIKRLMPTDLQAFRTFLADWAATRPWRQAIREGHLAAVARLKGAMDGESPTAALAAADEKLLDAMRQAGYRISDAEVQALRREASLAIDAAELRRLLTMELVMQRLADLENVQITEISPAMFFNRVRSPSGAEWLVGLAASPEFANQARQAGMPLLGMTADRVRQVAANRMEDSRLSAVQNSVARVVQTQKGFGGFSNRTIWLLTVSLVVCAVGIANAMLMSVTERFREIATMKCLGATDGYIMINFILESCLQGTAGGIVGAVLGFLLGTLRSTVAYGWMAMENLPLLPCLAVAGASVIAGVILSAFAAVYPAWIAARLAPMEAMRIE